MPKKMMTGARTGLAQMENRMCNVVMGSPHPERVLKDEVMRIKGTLPPGTSKKQVVRVVEAAIPMTN